MSQRRLLIDRSPGEVRGVVLLDGRPERLLIERADDQRARLGERFAARVTRVDRIAGLAFVDLCGEDGALRLKADRPPPVQGALLQVEVTAESQRGKGAVVRVEGAGEGEPRRLDERAGAVSRLQAYAPRVKIEQDPQTREMVDEAEAEALAVEHPLPGGGSVAIEPTRALVSVDVDLGGRQGVGGDTKQAARQANMAALRETARLLRLKGLGGLVVIDLIGRGHDGPALLSAARIAFAPDQPGVVLGQVTRFGTLELSLPQRGRPIAALLCGPDGRPTVQTAALRLMRALEREGRVNPGARLQARCAPEVEALAQALAPSLADRIGARFALVADGDLPRERFIVAAT